MHKIMSGAFCTYADLMGNRFDRRAEWASANGHPGYANRLDQKGDRIDRHLDRKGDRIDHRYDSYGSRNERNKLSAMHKDRQRKSNGVGYRARR